MSKNTAQIRKVPVITEKTQVLLESAWIDLNLVIQLYENNSNYGFAYDDYVLDNLDNRDQLAFMETNGFAFQGTRGGWYGTNKLVEFCKEHLAGKID